MVEDQQPDASKSAIRRRYDTLWGTLRRFSRLWGFLAFAVFVVILFRGIVLPFIFGLLVAYLLAPIVARLRPRIGRVGGVVLCYIVILALLAAFFGLLLPAVFHDLARLRETAPVAIEEFSQQWLPRASRWVENTFGDFLAPTESPPPPTSELIMTPLGDGSFRIDLESARLQIKEMGDGSYVVGPPTDEGARIDFRENIKTLLSTQGAELTSSIGPFIQAFIAGVTGFLTNFVITFMIAAFVLVDLSRVQRFARSLIPYEFRPDYDELLKGADKGLSGVIRGQLLICLVNGTFTFIGLLIFGVKYSVLLAVLAGVFSLIPIFGTIISSIPIVIVALVSAEQGIAVYKGVMILLWIALIHFVEANILNPKIIGDSAHIHPVIVIFALLAGEHVFGLVGALLAIPATSLIQTIYMYARRRATAFRDPELRP